MKKTKIVLCALLAFVAIALPFASVAVTAVMLPPAFENSFVSALDDKTELLYTTGEEKIVVVGGSSVAFGIDSDLISRYTGMPVINYGLYAALGTKLMLDMSRGAIGEGDIVILAPELDTQTLSLYFNSKETLRAVDGSFSLLKYVRAKHLPSLLGASWSFAAEKIKYLREGIPDPDGVYNAKSFNQNGDVIYAREQNVMPLGYDPNTVIDLRGEIFSEDFVEYLNDYADYARGKGAKVYFGFCPVNSAALKKGTDEDSLSEFEEYIDGALDVTRISNISDYVYDPGYFYDTNFHLNDSGKTKHSVNLVRDLLLELGIPTSVNVEIPDPPALMYDVAYDGVDENAKYFTYELNESGAYTVTGVRAEYKDMTELTIPCGYNGRKVTSLGSSALVGTSVKKLVITRDSNIRVLENGCFLGASALTELWIYYPSEEDITPPGSFEGASASLKVFVPEGSSYDVGYSWGQKGLDFEIIKEN